MTINGVTDQDGDPISISINSIFQDEPTNGLGDGDTYPDGGGIGTSTALIRAERAGNGDGRIYEIDFTADDRNGGICTGTVIVGVPVNQGRNGTPVNNGASFNSTQP